MPAHIRCAPGAVVARKMNRRPESAPCPACKQVDGNFYDKFDAERIKRGGTAACKSASARLGVRV